MNKTKIHDCWAPPDSRWSPWVKPVLFAHLDTVEVSGPVRSPGEGLEHVAPRLLEELRRRDSVGIPYRQMDRAQDTALVIDLPGVEGTLVGIGLARHGFRPVPLYNALPASGEVVEVRPILPALIKGAEVVRAVRPDAPPAFLLDASRTVGHGRIPERGEFDNRSVCYPTDFPSAVTLRTAGIRRVVLVRAGSAQPAADLAPILFAWQQHGIELFFKDLDGEGDLAPLLLPRPSWLRQFAHWFESLYLERRSDGTFGGAAGG